MITAAGTVIASPAFRRWLPRSWMAIALLMGLGELGVGSEPMTLVVLPPRGTAALDNKTATAVELLCDQLSKELAEDGGLRVVDRTQIEKVLVEKALNGHERPALAYDAMLRVTVDLLRAQPAVILEVIDLSTGNIGGSSEWPWALEPPPGRLREMAKLCRESAFKAMAASQRRVKLRLLGVAAPGGMGRLESMRQQFEEMVEQVAGRCPTVCVVRHLEAFTAKEESLLLLLGHARLAGGRQFTPQADVTLEIQLVETNAQGKTFADTGIEIRFRLSKGTSSGDWTRISGRVADWRKLVPTACESLARQLGEARPHNAAQYASEMMVRRFQAEAELEAALNGKRRPDKLDLPRVAAAAKLDPSYEPAAYWLVEGLCFQGAAKDTLRESLRYLEMFDRQPRHRKRVTELAHYRAQPVPDLQETETLRRIVEIGMGGNIDSYDPYCGWMVGNVYQGMRAGGVEPRQRMQWLDHIHRRVPLLTAQVEQVEQFLRGNVDSSLLRVRSFLVAFAVEDGEPALARQRLREFMACRRSVSRDSWELAKKLRETVSKMADEPLLRDYDRWLAELTTPVRQIELTWKDYPVYERTGVRPKVLQFSAMLPMTASPAAVYGVSGVQGYKELTGWNDRQPSGHGLAYVPVDAEGRPSGPATPLPLPALNKDIAITGAAFLAGNLYVATKRTGLLVCDVHAGKWSQIGPEQGLVDWCVFFMQPLDERRLLVVAGHPSERVAYCTFDVKTKQTTLVHRLDSSRSGWSALFYTPRRVWWEGDRLMAMSYVGLARDVLKARPKFVPWPDVWPHGWKCRPHTFSSEPTSIAAVGDKRYVMATTGLHEIDSHGKVLRTWGNHLFFYAGGPDHDNLARDAITTPGDLPAEDVDSAYTFVCRSQDRLFLVSNHAELLCYEPSSDTWLGPLRLWTVGADLYPLGGSNGVWIGGTAGAIYVEASAFIDAAKAAGRVMTSAEIRRRKRELAEKAGPLEAAKLDLLWRDFAGARRRAEAILATDPNNPQALLLMAVIYDFWCLNRPQEALTWYNRLSAMDTNLSAVYTGLYGSFRIHYTLDRWDQAIATGELLLNKVPCLYAGMTPEIERFMEYARNARDKAAAQGTDPTGTEKAVESTR